MRITARRMADDACRWHRLANLMRRLRMGFVTGYCVRNTAIPPAMCRAATTGFRGGPAMSAETVGSLLRREHLGSAIGIAGHVAGSLLMTVRGILLFRVRLSLKEVS